MAAQICGYRLYQPVHKEEVRAGWRRRRVSGLWGLLMTDQQWGGGVRPVRSGGRCYDASQLVRIRAAPLRLVNKTEVGVKHGPGGWLSPASTGMPYTAGK